MKISKKNGRIWMSKQKKASAVSSLYRKRRQTGILFLLPIFLGISLFFVLPFAMVISYSFGAGGGQVRFAGLENYRKVLGSEAFQLAAGNTLKFLCIGVPLLLVVALGAALLLREAFPGWKLCSNTMLLPLVLPIASIVMVVEWLVPVSVLENSSAFWVLLGLYLWKNFGYVTVLLLAGLSMIPKELYDTAAIEGANCWQKFWYITLPLIVPSLAFSTVIGVMNNFKSYREAFLLGGTHPQESIYMMQHFLNNNFQNLNYSRLSVASIMTALPIVLMTVGILLWTKIIKQ